MGILTWNFVILLLGVCQAVQEQQLSCEIAQVYNNASLASFCSSAAVSFDECCRRCKASKSCVSFEVSDRCYLSKKTVTKGGSTGSVYVLIEKLQIIVAATASTIPKSTTGKTITIKETTTKTTTLKTTTTKEPRTTTPKPAKCISGKDAMYTTPFVYQRLSKLEGPYCDDDCLQDPNCKAVETTEDGECYLLSHESVDGEYEWSVAGNGKIKLTDCPNPLTVPDLVMLPKYTKNSLPLWGIQLPSPSVQEKNSVCLAKNNTDTCKNLVDVTVSDGRRIFKQTGGARLSIGSFCTNTYGTCGATQAIYEYFNDAKASYLYVTRSSVENPLANGYRELRLFCYGWPGGNCDIEESVA